jgi:hypothetical protein
MSPPVERIGRPTRDWPLFAGIAIVVVAVVLSTLKPWGTGSMGAAATSAGDAIVTSGSPNPEPTATPRPTPADPASSFCLAPSGWRLMSLERFDKQTIRVWQTIDPIAATGPTDPRLPTGLVVSTAVLGVGWCTPTTGPDRPTGPVTVQVWSLDNHGIATRIAVRADTGPSDQGADYLPPSANGAQAPDWSPGRYVFAIKGRDDAAGHWFAVEVRRYVPDRPSASPGPSPSSLVERTMDTE